MISTLRNPATWLGLLGSLLIAAGELRRLTTWSQVQGQAWVDTVTSVVPATYQAVIAAGIAILSVAWLLAKPRAGRPPLSVGLLAVLWTLPLLLLPPMLSTDADSYADLGWMVANGDNPYTTGLGTTHGPFPLGRAWLGTTSVYPPGALQLFGWVVHATGSHWYFSVVALRALALLGLLLIWWAVPRLARAIGVDAGFATWLAVLNPLMLVHGVGGEHVDLMMAGLVALALALAAKAADRAGDAQGSRASWLWFVGATVAVGMAVSVKQPALLAIPAVAALAIPIGRRTWPRFIAACTIVGAGALGTFALISAATGLGWGWLSGTGNPANAPQTLTPAYLLSVVSGIDVASLTQAGQDLSGILIVLLFVRHGRTESLRYLGLVALVWALGFGVLREWYLIFPMAFIGLARPGRPLRATVWILAPMLALYGTWREYQRGVDVLASATNAVLWASGIALFAWVVWQLTRPDAYGPSSAPSNLTDRSLVPATRP